MPTETGDAHPPSSSPIATKTPASGRRSVISPPCGITIAWLHPPLFVAPATYSCGLLAHPLPFGYDSPAMEPTAVGLAVQPPKKIGCRKIATAVLALLMLCALPDALQAQVFIATKPHPDFWIAPVFISASVGRQNVTRERGSVTLNVSWSVAPPPNRDPASIAQDLYLLWPGEVSGTAGGGADPSLARQVEGAGFKILTHGQVPLVARSRLQMGTGPSTGLRPLGGAPFVTFARPESLARGARPASYIRIPWKPELASLDWLARLELPVKGAITTKEMSWLEETFWGRRYIITLSFGDVGYSSLYPLYFGNRDRLVPLAPDFSMLVINFADSGHLKVDEVVPMSANRRKSETRPDTETFSVPLVAAEGLVPHVLRVQFAYFRGRLPWQPILFSALLLGLGNLTGPARCRAGPADRSDAAGSRASGAGRGARPRERHGALEGGAGADPARRDHLRGGPAALRIEPRGRGAAAVGRAAHAGLPGATGGAAGVAVVRMVRHGQPLGCGAPRGADRLRA